MSSRVTRSWMLILCLSFVGPLAHGNDLARVNGKAITDQDLKGALSGLPEGQRKSVLKDLNTRKQVLGSLIDQEILLQEAERQKLDQDNDFKQAEAMFRKQYLSSRLLQKNVGNLITESAAKKYYNSNKKRFSTDQVHVQHILVDDERVAQDLLKKAQVPNADFQELAEKYSKDPSAKNNRGDLGAITRDSPFVREFKDAAFDAAEGDIIGPVKTAFGYHIIKVLKKKVGKPLNYDEVELHVKEELKQKIVEDYVSKLRGRAKIQLDEKSLEKI